MLFQLPMQTKILTMGKISLLSIALAISTAGQTATDLATKYHPVSAYELRPGILMTARYADDGQICEAVIETRHYHPPTGIDLRSTIAESTERELIDELAPPPIRGKETSRWLKHSYLQGGILHLEHDYENVLIVTDGDQNSGDEILTIHWKKRTCANSKPTAVASNK
ncbi:MAG TPA: hypothetical protein VI636_00040 [Candidatus Angelobacter sp.]